MEHRLFVIVYLKTKTIFDKLCFRDLLQSLYILAVIFSFYKQEKITTLHKLCQNTKSNWNWFINLIYFLRTLKYKFILICIINVAKKVEVCFCYLMCNNNLRQRYSASKRQSRKSIHKLKIKNTIDSTKVTWMFNAEYERET